MKLKTDIHICMEFIPAAETAAGMEAFTVLSIPPLPYWITGVCNRDVCIGCVSDRFVSIEYRFCGINLNEPLSCTASRLFRFRGFNKLKMLKKLNPELKVIGHKRRKSRGAHSI